MDRRAFFGGLLRGAAAIGAVAAASRQDDVGVYQFLAPICGQCCEHLLMPRMKASEELVEAGMTCRCGRKHVVRFWKRIG